MLSSKVLDAAERNIRNPVYNGQNSQEIWGGIPAVILFGGDYQLWPVIEKGAIQGYSKMTTMATLTPTNKQDCSTAIIPVGNIFIYSSNDEIGVPPLQKLQGEIKGIPKFTCQTAYRGINS